MTGCSIKKTSTPTSSCNDKDSEFGPPDKRRHFNNKEVDGKNTQVIIGQEVEVRYDDNVWYKGKLIEQKLMSG